MEKILQMIHRVYIFKRMGWWLWKTIYGVYYQYAVKKWRRLQSNTQNKEFALISEGRFERCAK
jgi:hypothetical protein